MSNVEIRLGSFPLLGPFDVIIRHPPSCIVQNWGRQLSKLIWLPPPRLSRPSVFFILSSILFYPVLILL